MNDADDNHIGIRIAVIQRVIAVKVHSQPFGQMIPAGAYFRMGQKRGETVFDLTDKLRGGARVILRDEAPDIG